MRWLADTNVLLRWVQPDHPLNPVVHAAVDCLRDRGDSVFVTPQNLIEFRCVATRPRNVNGLGMEPWDADAELRNIERLFLLAPDDPRIYGEWGCLVAACGVSGVQVHDARLAAVMHIHALTHILTLNADDFKRYPGITPVHPRDLAAVS